MAFLSLLFLYHHFYKGILPWVKWISFPFSCAKHINIYTYVCVCVFVFLCASYVWVEKEKAVILCSNPASDLLCKWNYAARSFAALNYLHANTHILDFYTYIRQGEFNVNALCNVALDLFYFSRHVLNIKWTNILVLYRKSFSNNQWMSLFYFLTHSLHAVIFGNQIRFDYDEIKFNDNFLEILLKF